MLNYGLYILVGWRSQSILYGLWIQINALLHDEGFIDGTINFGVAFASLSANIFGRKVKHFARCVSKLLRLIVLNFCILHIF